MEDKKEPGNGVQDPTACIASTRWDIDIPGNDVDSPVHHDRTSFHGSSTALKYPQQQNTNDIYINIIIHPIFHWLRVTLSKCNTIINKKKKVRSLPNPKNGLTLDVNLVVAKPFIKETQKVKTVNIKGTKNPVLGNDTSRLIIFPFINLNLMAHSVWL